jgi:hypothetical protein
MDEAFPSRNDLNLVEAPVHGSRGPEFGETSVVFLDENPEVASSNARETLVLEVDEGQALGLRTSLEGLAPELVEEGCLSSATHADNSRYLARHSHRTEVFSLGRSRRRQVDAIGELFREQPGDRITHGDRIIVGHILLPRRNSIQVLRFMGAMLKSR